MENKKLLNYSPSFSSRLLAVGALVFLVLVGSVSIFFQMRFRPASAPSYTLAPHIPAVRAASVAPLPEPPSESVLGSFAHIPVLMYHYVRTVEDPHDRLGYSLSVTPKDFEEQMAYLFSNGYTAITPDQLFYSLEKGLKLGKKTIILTFDDGYADFYNEAFPILSKYKMKATLFVVTGFVGDADHRYVTWDQLRQMDKSGLITIASHTISHPDLRRSKDAFTEITESKRLLESGLGHPITGFAYPFGAYNSSTAQLVAASGYNIAFTTREGTLQAYNTRFFEPRVRIYGGMPISIFEEKVQMLKKQP